MKAIARFAALVLLPWSTSALAATADGCAPLAGLIRQARSDFQSLANRSFESGTCVSRKNEFRCSWTFPGDAFANAEVQSARVQHCALAQPAVEAIGSKKGETGFTLEDDLLMFVSAPELDMGEWVVRIRLVEKQRAQ